MEDENIFLLPESSNFNFVNNKLNVIKINYYHFSTPMQRYNPTQILKTKF